MNRIYEVSLLEGYVLQTTFFNGEVRTLNIELNLRENPRFAHLLKYAELSKCIHVNSSRTGVEIEGGPNFSHAELYQGGLLVRITYIEDANVQLAARVQAMRESRGMTQKELELASGIHQAEISKIERAIGNPSVETIVRLAAAAGYSMDISFVNRRIRRDVPEAVQLAPYLKAGKYQGEYVISDLDDVPEDMFFELINGCIYDRGVPTLKHSMIIGDIKYKMESYIRSKGGPCRAFSENAGLTFENDDKNYLIPDLMIVCDRDKIKEEFVVGAPDFVLEVASPSNRKRDYHEKEALYFEKGVREYWILDPQRGKLVVYYFERDDIPVIYDLQDTVPVGIYNGELQIDLSELVKIEE